MGTGGLRGMPFRVDEGLCLAQGLEHAHHPIIEDVEGVALPRLRDIRDVEHDCWPMNPVAPVPNDERMSVLAPEAIELNSLMHIRFHVPEADDQVITKYSCFGRYGNS